MKNYLAILLIGCLFLPFIGTWGYLHLLKDKHRGDISKQVMEGIQRNELVTLAFSMEEALLKLKWEHDREFEYKGQMYDIVDTEDRGDTVVYHCIADHRESRINREIRKATARAMGQDPARKNQSERLNQFLKSLMHPQIFTCPVPLFTSRILNPESCILNPASRSISPPSPPPKAA